MALGLVLSKPCHTQMVAYRLLARVYRIEWHTLWEPHSVRGGRSQNEIKVFGSLYCEFEDSPRIIEDTLRININDLKTRDEVLQWYIDINAGGTPHTKEEIERVRAMLSRP